MSQLPAEGLASNGTAAGARPQQRRFARADVTIAAQYSTASKSDKVAGEIVNLGGGGIRIASTEDLQRGEVVTVHFQLPSVKHEIIVRGKVVLSFYEAAGSRFAHGLAFTQIAVDDQASIVAHVESLQHQQADV